MCSGLNLGTMRAKIEIVEGDITKLRVDAVVNAANASLLGGGGVDGAIHRAAGPGLLEECRTIGGCPTGEATITSGYMLPARHVIHTVGPVWKGGRHGEDDLLERCYRNSLQRAREAQAKTIAFPAISTGIYRFPLPRAAHIAIGTVQDELRGDHGCLMVVTFCTFGAAATAIYRETLERLLESE